MAAGWLCEACRSFNKSRDTRCYSCRVPRRAVEHDPASSTIVRSGLTAPATPLALAVRGGARYRPSWILALVIAPLILAVAVLDWRFWPAAVGRLRADGSFIGDPATTPLWGEFALEMGIMVAAGILWSLWIAACLGNIPALTGRYPGFGTSDALFAPLGRRSGYYRPMHIVREVVDEFRGDRVWPGLLVTAWWAAWIGTIVVPGAVALVRQLLGTRSLRDMLEAITVRPYLVAVAAVLAIGVLVVVEWLQLGARRQVVATLAAAERTSGSTAGGSSPAAGGNSPAVTGPDASMIPEGPMTPDPMSADVAFSADVALTADDPGAERPPIAARPARSGPPRPPAVSPSPEPSPVPSARRKRGLTPGIAIAGLAVVGAIAVVALVGTGALRGPAPSGDPTTAGAAVDPSPARAMGTSTPIPTDAPVEHPVIARMLESTHATGVSGSWRTSTTIDAGPWVAEIARVDVGRAAREAWTRTWSPQSSGQLKVVAETALVKGRAYSRGPDQPWDERTAGADTPPPVVVGAEPWDTLVYEGRVRRDGERLHRIGFARYGEEMGAWFTDTLADRQATVTETSGWILVRDDGTPVLLQARIDGEIDGGTPAVLRVVTTYADIGMPMTITLGTIPRAVP